MDGFHLYFLLMLNSLLCHRPASAFLAATTSYSIAKSNFIPHELRQYSDSSFLVLHLGFEQLPGESTTQFIKRVTNQSDELLKQQESKENTFSGNTEEGSDNDPKPIGKYQRIEEWDAERNAKGELSWEEKVQFEGQRYGNQLKQDSILRRHLGTF